MRCVGVSNLVIKGKLSSSSVRRCVGEEIVKVSDVGSSRTVRRVPMVNELFSSRVCIVVV